MLIKQFYFSEKPLREQVRYLTVIASVLAKQNHLDLLSKAL